MYIESAKNESLARMAEVVLLEPLQSWGKVDKQRSESRRNADIPETEVCDTEPCRKIVTRTRTSRASGAEQGLSKHPMETIVFLLYASSAVHPLGLHKTTNCPMCNASPVDY